MVDLPLPLHSRVSRDEALKAFGPAWYGRSYCEDQFAVTRKAILLFARIGRGGTVLQAADRLEWRPDRADYHSGEKIPWLPKAVTPEYDHKRKAWKREMYVFLAMPEDDGWLFAGRAHLGSYEYSNNRETKGYAAYHIPRLPRAEWLALGGYRGWRVMVNGEAETLEPSEGERFGRLLTGVSEGVGHVSLTRWEGDEMSVHLNERRGFPMYLREPGDTGLYVLGEDAGGAETEKFACGCCGIELEFTGDLTVPRATALDLLRGYFKSGSAPKDGASAPGGIWVRDLQ